MQGQMAADRKKPNPQMVPMRIGPIDHGATTRKIYHTQSWFLIPRTVICNSISPQRKCRASVWWPRSNSACIVLCCAKCLPHQHSNAVSSQQNMCALLSGASGLLCAFLLLGPRIVIVWSILHLSPTPHGAGLLPPTYTFPQFCFYCTQAYMQADCGRKCS